MVLELLRGYPDLIGRRQVICGRGVGPVSYSQTTGDVLYPPSSYGRYIDIITEASQDPTGTYYAVGRPSAVGPRATWSLHWFLCSNSTEVVNGTNLSTFSLQVTALIGEN
jgi:hypothetical protein